MSSNESRQQRRARERGEAKLGGKVGSEQVTFGDYLWPRLTVIHRQYGSWAIDVHGVQYPDDQIVLVAFCGIDTAKQVETLDAISKGQCAPVAELSPDQISDDVAILLAAKFHEEPDAHIVLLQVEQATKQGGAA